MPEDVLKIYSNDPNDTSYDIYVNGTFAVNVSRYPENGLKDSGGNRLVDNRGRYLSSTEPSA